MSTRIRLGRSDLEVSPICYGSWQLSPRFWGDQPEDEIVSAMKRSFEVGVNFYDTADAYGDGLSERVMGEALKDLPRKELVIATKCYWHFYEDGHRHPDLTRQYILNACDASLKRLNMDYIDLYQLHSHDPLSSYAEAIDALDTLVKQGKIRAYGLSNWNETQMQAGHALGGNFATLQPPYSLINRASEERVLPYCHGTDMGVLVYSPLHKGLLSGKYKGTEKFDDFRKDNADFKGERFKQICDAVAKVSEIAKGYQLSTIQLVLAITLMHPAIHCAIVGVKKPAHIEEAAGAIGKTISHDDAWNVRNLLTIK